MKYILVNHNYDPSWVKEFTDDYLIYDRSDEKWYLHGFESNKIIHTANIGNADYDRLTYIIDNYDDLPDVFVLAKSNLFKYIKRSEFEKLKGNKKFTPLLTQYHETYEPICRYNDGIYEELNNSWYVPQFKTNFSSYNSWADYMEIPKSDYLQFAPGGNYILTKEVVHKYSKGFYIKMRNTLAYTKLPAEAQFVERAYYTLWNTQKSPQKN